MMHDYELLLLAISAISVIMSFSNMREKDEIEAENLDLRLEMLEIRLMFRSFMKQLRDEE